MKTSLNCVAPRARSARQTEYGDNTYFTKSFVVETICFCCLAQVKQFQLYARVRTCVGSP